MPEGVLGELAVKRAPPDLAGFLAGGTARAGRRGAPRGPRAEKLPRRTGMGEADAIRIVDGRGGRTFKGYLILTDDRPAQARAGSLGMGPLDVAEFLLTANGAGLATAGRAADAPDAPEASGYRLGEGVRERFTRSLV